VTINKKNRYALAAAEVNRSLVILGEWSPCARIPALPSAADFDGGTAAR
jgi:hypothetical protein